MSWALGWMLWSLVDLHTLFGSTQNEFHLGGLISSSFAASAQWTSGGSGMQRWCPLYPVFPLSLSSPPPFVLHHTKKVGSRQYKDDLGRGGESDVLCWWMWDFLCIEYNFWWERWSHSHKGPILEQGHKRSNLRPPNDLFEAFKIPDLWPIKGLTWGLWWSSQCRGLTSPRFLSPGSALLALHMYESPWGLVKQSWALATTLYRQMWQCFKANTCSLFPCR